MIVIATLAIYLLSLIGIVAITFQTNINTLPDVSGLYEKSVSFTKVFTSNTILVIQNIFLGLLTIGIYGINVLAQNVILLGSISNSLIVHSMTPLVYKMIPHGIIEILGISFSVVVPFAILIRGFNSAVRVIKREEKILSALKDLGLFIIKSICFLIVIFFIAAIVEVIVSRINFM